MKQYYQDLEFEDPERFEDACKYGFSKIKAVTEKGNEDDYTRFLLAAEQLSNYLLSDEYRMFNTVQNGMIQRKGRWCNTEERYLNLF